MAIIGAIADDLTGATTVGALLARSGVDTAVFFKSEYLETNDFISNHQAVVVSTDSRSLPADDAYKRVREATLSMKKVGIQQFSKRTDTTLRGGIGIEIDAMLDMLGKDYVAVMVPSMPQSNRILIGGYSLINGVPLSKTPVANDVKTPVRESFIPRLIANQTRRKIGYIGLDQLLRGKSALRDALAESRESGAQVFLVDTTSMSEVEMVAQAVVDLKWNIVSVDPGPFTERLAYIRGWASNTRSLRKVRTESEPDDKGTVLVVAGSATPVTTSQMKALKRVTGTYAISVKVMPLLSGEKTRVGEIARVLKEAERVVNSSTPPRVLILAFETTLTGNLVDFVEQEHVNGLAPGESANQIALSLGEIANEIMKKISDKIIGLYLTGGDVMVNVCEALGVRGIELIDYVIPQADQGRLIGGRYDGLSVIGKGGLTGEEKTAVQCVNRLFDERK